VLIYVRIPNMHINLQSPLLVGAMWRSEQMQNFLEAAVAFSAQNGGGANQCLRLAVGIVLIDVAFITS